MPSRSTAGSPSLAFPLGPALMALMALMAVAAAGAFAVERRVHKVSATAVVGSDVAWLSDSSSRRISPDGEWIVWVQDAEVNDAHALWAARRWGGPAKRLSGTLPPGDDFEVVRFSPDSKQVLYTAQQEASERYDLYTVPLLGTVADVVKLSPPLPETESVRSHTMKFSPDGSRIVFNTTHPGTSGHTLFSAPVDGSAAAVGLDGPFDDDGQTLNFVVAASRVVFQRQESTGDPYEIWSVPVAGGIKVRLTPPILGTGGAAAPNLAPGGAWVVFLLKDAPTQPADEPWSAAVLGGPGSAVRLADVPAAGGNTDDIWRFSPDGSRVVFKADRITDQKDEIFSVPTNGSSPPVKLNTGLIAAGDVHAFQISADGSTVVYAADWAVDERDEIFSVPILGPSASSVRLNRPLVAGESAIPTGPIGDVVVYAVGDAAGSAIYELRGAPLAGPASAEWPILLAQTHISAPGFIHTERLVLKADLAGPGEFELWAAKNDGSSAPNSLYNPIWDDVELGLVSGITPDSSEFFFLAAIDGGPLHLWATRADGLQGLPRRLSAEPAGNGGVIDDQFDPESTPDGFGVLYEADSETPGREELFISDALIFAADFDEEGDLSEWAP
jgi:hypothetical protein